MILNRLFAYIYKESFEDESVFIMPSIMIIVLLALSSVYLAGLYPVWQFWAFLFVCSELIFWLDKRKTYDTKSKRFWMTLVNKLSCIVDATLLLGLGAVVWNKILPNLPRIFEFIIEFLKGFGIAIGIASAIALITWLNSLKHKVEKKRRRRRKKK